MAAHTPERMQTDLPYHSGRATMCAHIHIILTVFCAFNPSRSSEMRAAYSQRAKQSPFNNRSSMHFTAIYSTIRLNVSEMPHIRDWYRKTSIDNCRCWENTKIPVDGYVSHNVEYIQNGFWLPIDTFRGFLQLCGALHSEPSSKWQRRCRQAEKTEKASASNSNRQQFRICWCRICRVWFEFMLHVRWHGGYSVPIWARWTKERETESEPSFKLIESSRYTHITSSAAITDYNELILTQRRWYGLWHMDAYGMDVNEPIRNNDHGPVKNFTHTHTHDEERREREGQFSIQRQCQYTFPFSVSVYRTLHADSNTI